MSKRRRAGAGRRIAEQRFWGGGSAPGEQPAAGSNGSGAVAEGGAGLATSDPAAGGQAAASRPVTPAAPTSVHLIRPTTDPAAVVRSLGGPPFAIDPSVAERHLTAVYEEAVRAATALAAANGLLAADEDDENG